MPRPDPLTVLYEDNHCLAVSKPPRLLTLEIALEYIEDDELVEVTPSKIRLRKKVLSEEGRKRLERSGGKKVGV